MKKTNQRKKNNNKIESFLSGQSKDANIEAKTKQIKKKRKQKKIKSHCLIFQKTIHTDVNMLQKTYYKRLIAVIKASMITDILNFMVSLMA